VHKLALGDGFSDLQQRGAFWQGRRFDWTPSLLVMLLLLLLK